MNNLISAFNYAQKTSLKFGCYPVTSPVVAAGRLTYAIPSLVGGALAALIVKVANCRSNQNINHIDANTTPSCASYINRFNNHMLNEVQCGLLELIPGVKMAIAIRLHHTFANLDVNRATEAQKSLKENIDTIYHFTDELGNLPIVSTSIGGVRIGSHLVFGIFNTVAYIFNKAIQCCVKDKALATAKTNAAWYYSTIWHENIKGIGKGALELFGVKGVLKLFFSPAETVPKVNSADIIETSEEPDQTLNENELKDFRASLFANLYQYQSSNIDDDYIRPEKIQNLFNKGNYKILLKNLSINGRPTISEVLEQLAQQEDTYIPHFIAHRVIAYHKHYPNDQSVNVYKMKGLYNFVVPYEDLLHKININPDLTIVALKMTCPSEFWNLMV